MEEKRKISIEMEEEEFDEYMVKMTSINSIDVNEEKSDDFNGD